MTLDALMYEWLKTKVSDLGRLEDPRDEKEPPRLLYRSTLFPRRNAAGSAEVYPSAVIVIRAEHKANTAFNNSGGALDTAVDSVLTALSGQSPVLLGYETTPLEPAAQPRVERRGDLVWKDIPFFVTIASGFAQTPITGGEGAVSIVGLDGQAKRYVTERVCSVEYEETGVTETVETVNLSRPRVSGYIDWILADSDTPLPVAGAEVSAVFAVHATHSWVDTIKINRIQHRVEVENTTELQIARIYFHVDSPTSPFFTGVAA